MTEVDGRVRGGRGRTEIETSGRRDRLRTTNYAKLRVQEGESLPAHSRALLIPSGWLVLFQELRINSPSLNSSNVGSIVDLGIGLIRPLREVSLNFK